MQNLHWLPVQYRIMVKILLLVFKSINGIAPSYICDLIQLHEPVRVLRSQGSHRLDFPKTRSRFGDRRFIVRPKLWNESSNQIKDADSINQFTTLLKTLLFPKAYDC